MSWRVHVKSRLLESQPESMCALDAAAQRMAGDVLPGTMIHPYETRRDSACALAFGIDVLNGLNAQQALNLISQVRLYVASRILIAVPLTCALDEAMFLSLGFTLCATDATEGMRVHYYDLDTYKTVPDWLNDRYWAHPERWEP